MSYKIEVNCIADVYVYYLFKRKFLLYKVVACDIGSIPIDNIVLEWQKRYSIPDRNISFINFKNNNQ